MTHPQKAKGGPTLAGKPGRRTVAASPWVSQMRRGLLEFLVLAVLSRGEAYGYVILKELQGIEGLGLTESTLYLLLARLAKDGLLRARQSRSPEGPPRRYYSLTTTGQERFVSMASYWDVVTTGVHELLAAGKR